ncbi:hypothetical protein FRC08_014670, partial [Ceratobasidium sp. 394]
GASSEVGNRDGDGEGTQELEIRRKQGNWSPPSCDGPRPLPRVARRLRDVLDGTWVRVASNKKARLPATARGHRQQNTAGLMVGVVGANPQRWARINNSNAGGMQGGLLDIPSGEWTRVNAAKV